MHKNAKNHELNEEINADIESHIPEDWEFTSFLSMIRPWARTFNDEFSLDVPLPAVGVKKLRKTRIAQYLCKGRDHHGIRFCIDFNSMFIGRDEWRSIGTMLHEMLHLWEETHGKPPAANRHSKAFRDKAKEYGLLVDSRGVTKFAEGLFTELLSRELVDFDLTKESEMDDAIDKSKQRKARRKWMCACPDSVTIPTKIGRVLNITCGTCNNAFFFEDPVVIIDRDEDVEEVTKEVEDLEEKLVDLVAVVEDEVMDVLADIDALEETPSPKRKATQKSKAIAFKKAIDNLSNNTKNELKVMAKELEISTKGTKHDLALRIVNKREGRDVGAIIAEVLGEAA